MEVSSDIRKKILILLANGYSYNYVSRRFDLPRNIIIKIEEDDLKVFSPAYDPYRDGERPYDSLTALILGDPPIGRRALDMTEDEPTKISLTPIY